MLFAQVPRSLREKVSAEFGFNLGVASGSVKAEANRFDEPVARLRAVERDLVANNEIGTIEEPRDWFAGEMMARTVGFRTKAKAVFFVGKVLGTIVTLGGSQRNLLGAKPSPSDGESSSDFTPMLDALEAVLLDELSWGGVERMQVVREDVHRVWPWHELVESVAVSSIDASRQQVHFLARLLGATHGTSERVVLGTPLYVAGGAANPL
jgi:hypothetical protein